MAKSNNRRVYPEANHQPCHKAEFRLTDAKARQVAFAALSVADKLHLLDVRLGKGVGATKQRAKLDTLLTKQNTVKKDVSQEK